MLRLQAGHSAALNDLMDRYGAALVRFLSRGLQNEDDAADLAQETFVRVYQNRARFDPRQRFSTWLYSIAANLMKDRFRWRARHPELSIDAQTAGGENSIRDILPAAGPLPGDEAQAHERAQTIRKAVANLPEDLRTPLILAEFEEKSQAEIAAILGCTVKAVENRIYRARQRLRQDLAEFLRSEK